MPLGNPRYIKTSYNRAGKGKRKYFTYKKWVGKSTSPSQAAASAITKAKPLGVLWKAPPAFVDNKIVKLKYHAAANLSVTAGAMTYNSFRLNSIYDPDLTGVGGQPRYYDQLLSATGPYLRYRVLGCKVKIQFVNDNSSAGALGYVGMYARDSTAAAISSVDLTGLTELQNTKYTILGNMNSSKGIRVLKNFYNIAKVMGVQDIADNEDAEGAYNGNPTDSVLLDVYYYPLDGATTTSIYALVDLEYIVQLMDLNTVAAS